MQTNKSFNSFDSIVGWGGRILRFGGMSLNLLKAKHWLMLLVDPNTSYQQRRILLDSPSDLQIKALREIFYNILHNPNIDIDSSLLKKAKTKKWKVLVKPNVSKQKRKFIKDNKRAIVIFLLELKDLLLEILEYD